MRITKIVVPAATLAFFLGLTGRASFASPMPQSGGRQAGSTTAKAAATIGPTTEASPAYLSALKAQRAQGAIALWDAAQRSYLEGSIGLDRLIAASEKLLEAEGEAANTDARQSAETRHIGRLSNLVSKVLEPRVESGRGSTLDLIEARLALTTAMLQQADKNQAASIRSRAPSPNPAGWLGNSVEEGFHFRDNDRFFYGCIDRDPRSLATFRKLEQFQSFPFEADTPLEQVLDHLRKATQGENQLPYGIQIYLDEVGMQEANTNVTPASTVKIRLDGVPARTALRLMLRQLGLVYVVKDGILMISSPESIVREIDEARFHAGTDGSALP
ncbi:MAG: hypothetical protein U0800_16535 [Isosphaeraceae bacterium]